MSPRWPSGTSGTSARSASIARRASSRSRVSGASFPYASDANIEVVCRTMSPTFILRSSSTSCSAVGVDSPGDSLTGTHLFGEDLLHPRAVLERATDTCCERIDQGRESARLRKVGLRVADADLDGREHEVRPHAPPDLRVLGDRPGLVEEAHVALPVVPALEPVGDAATR